MKKEYKWNARTQSMVPVRYDKGDVNAPFVEDDTIPPTVSHATDEGRVFESRKALYQHYKENGVECVGKESNIHTGRGVTDRTGRVFDCPEERSRKIQWGMLKIDSAIHAEVSELNRKLKWGMAPLSEREKHSCQTEEKKYRDYCKNQRA